MGTIGGNLLPGDALLVLAAQVPVLPARRRPLPRARGPAPRARDLRQRASARPRTRPTSRRRCSRSARRVRTTRRELPLAELYRLPTDDDRDLDDARAGRADPRARRARAGGERLPEGDGPAALGVPARRRRRGRAPAASCASASPASRRSRGRSTARPTSTRRRRCPGTAYKVEIARALVGARRPPCRLTAAVATILRRWPSAPSSSCCCSRLRSPRSPAAAAGGDDDGAAAPQQQLGLRGHRQKEAATCRI